MAEGGARRAAWALSLASVAASVAWLPPAGASSPNASCDFGPPTTIKRLAGQPALALRTVLRVLRRPALAGDRLPHGLGTQSSFLYGPGRSVNVAYIRLVGVLPDGSHVFVIPGYMERWRRPRRACLRRMSPKHRRDLLRFIAHQKRRPDLNVVTVDDDGRGFNGHSATVGDIKSGATTEISPSVFRPHTTIDGLVPDGVASVTIDGPSDKHADVTVADNFFVAELPISVAAKDHLTLTWHAADGAVIKTINYPPGPQSEGGSFDSGSSGFTVPSQA